MVRKAEKYPYSSQRAYLGLEAVGVVDVDPVLRLFGARKNKARENFARYVGAGAKLGHQEEFYKTGEGGILGSDEFVDEAIHRLGETNGKMMRRQGANTPEFNAKALIGIVENLLETKLVSFYGSGKGARSVFAKELLIVTGRQVGATVTTLSELTGLDPSTVSRRHDAARLRMHNNEDLQALTRKVLEQWLRIAILQA